MLDAANLPTVTIKAGHVQPVWAGHPWVFAQAIESKDPATKPGDEVIVLDPTGKVLGRGLYSASSAIAVRLFSFDAAVAVDESLIRSRVQRAILLRRASGLPEPSSPRATTGYRLVHGEGDGLPGLIVDVYEDVLAVQFGTIGLKRREAVVLDALEAFLSPKAIVDRTPGQLARAEGFGLDTVGTTEGTIVRGDATLDRLTFHELGLRYELPLAFGQKTGYYFDQRPLRSRLIELARGARVLDTCCYVGSFALLAAQAGAAHVTGVDKSEAAIEVGRKIAELNGLGDRLELLVEDAGNAMRRVAKEGGVDVLIVDPPKLAMGSAGTGSRRNLPKAIKAYRRLASEACGALAPGGLLAFCSCSASMDADALGRVLALGARQAGKRVVLLERTFQGPDHPVPAAFPEGLYLSCLVGRVDQP